MMVFFKKAIIFFLNAVTFLKNAEAFKAKRQGVLKVNTKLSGEGGEGLKEVLNVIDIDKKRSYPQG